MRLPARTALMLILAAAAFTSCGDGDSPTTPTPPPSTTPTVQISGTVTDPAGDLTLTGSPISPLPDLASATLTVQGANLLVAVRFHPGMLAQSTTVASVLLDIDDNVATGSPGISSGANPWDGDLIGVDFSITMGAFPNQLAPGQAIVFASGQQVGSVPQVFSGDTIEVTIPLALLDSDDGRMAFKVTSFARCPRPHSPPSRT